MRHGAGDTGQEAAGSWQKVKWGLPPTPSEPRGASWEAAPGRGRRDFGERITFLSSGFRVLGDG